MLNLDIFVQLTVVAVKLVANKVMLAYLSPLRTWTMMHLTCDSEKGVCMLSRREARSCSQNSMTRKMELRLRPTAISLSLEMESV